MKSNECNHKLLQALERSCYMTRDSLDKKRQHQCYESQKTNQPTLMKNSGTTQTVKSLKRRGTTFLPQLTLNHSHNTNANPL